MKIHNEFQQNSLEWLIARLGIPTASEFDNLVTPKWEIRKGEMPATYLSKKLAEAWSRSPLPGFSTIDMELGHVKEEEAVPWYEFEFSETIERVGFITTDDGRVGCSPDGLIGADGGIEIKCPAPHTHVKYLLGGELPKDYAAQVQGCMFVTDRQWWRFLSYCRGFPPLILFIERDDAAQKSIAEALGLFLDKLHAGMARLQKINAGAKIGQPIAVCEDEVGIIP